MNRRSRLRRAVLGPVRPLIRFFDVRFQHLEDRFASLEERVADDLESAAELFALMTRQVARLEQRLEEIERRLPTRRSEDAGNSGTAGAAQDDAAA
jgi:hypothetical protein